MSIDMSLDRIAVHAVQCRADGTVDDQAQGESEETVEEEVVRGSRRMVDLRKLKRSWTRKWKTTGVPRKMVTDLPSKLLPWMMLI